MKKVQIFPRMYPTSQTAVREIYVWDGSETSVSSPDTRYVQ